MLTRSQVARRLGKSIATVRRLEESVLYAKVDRNGVHWFDEWEVEQLKQEGKLPPEAQSEWFQENRPPSRPLPSSSTHGRSRPAVPQASTEDGDNNADAICEVVQLLRDFSRLSRRQRRELQRAGFFDDLIELLDQ